MAIWRLAEDLSADPTTVTVAGREYPVPCLVEADDGVRLLVLGPDQTEIRTATWVQAHSAGAAALVRVHSGGYGVQTAEQFMATRTDRPREGTFVPAGWRKWAGDGPPSFTDVVATEPTKTPVSLARGGDAPSLVGADGRRRYVSLHTHTEHSHLDGCSRIADLADRAAADGHPALAITDHGNCEGHPDLQAECARVGINPIFGIEAYFQDDRFRRAIPWKEGDSRTREEAKVENHDAQYGYWHLTLLAMDNVGLRNLWAMSTESYRTGLYAKFPRMDWDILKRLNTGVIATTGCLGGPICKALEEGKPDEARLRLARLHQIFGDRLYVELGAIDLPKQRDANKQLVELARELSIPLVVASDSHYTESCDKGRHRDWLRMQPSVKEDSYLVTEHSFEPFRTTDEIESAISYLGPDVVAEAMANTVRVAERCTARIASTQQLPVYSKGADGARRDAERLIEMCMANWQRKVAGKPHGEDAYLARFEREMNLYISRALCGFVLITADITRFAKEGGCLVGPARGSAGASLVMYLADIIEIDPVEADLPFERFLTEERIEMPDVDLDFPSSWKSRIHEYVRERWGEDHVVRIGTHAYVRVKSAVDMARGALVQADRPWGDWSTIQAFKRVVDQYAATLSGQQPEWDDVWRLYAEELAPLRNSAPELFDLAGWICGLLRTSGKHPAGLAISTDEPLTYLPLRADKEDDESQVMVTQWDYRQLDATGKMKFDFLFLSSLDVFQQVLDLIEARHGRRPNIYDWRDELLDPQVWEAIAAGRTLGVFQVETRDGQRLCRRFKPQSIADLAAIMALGRPGPKESGLDKIYLRRRFGEEPITYPDPRLEKVLGDTYGVVLFQEQVMATAVDLGGYSLGEADTKIRKPLGKKLPEKMREAGIEFKRRALERGMEPQAFDTLWAQLEEFSRYAFGRSHSWSYATIAYWAAWLKVHFPLEFFTGVLTHVDNDRVPEFIDEMRRLGLKVLPPDVNESGVWFQPAGLAVRYGLGQIKGLGEVTAPAIVAGQPYASYQDFIDRMVTPKGSKVNIGHLAILAKVGAFDALVPNRRALETQLARESSGDGARCTYRDDGVQGPNDLPCTFDWHGEPDPPTWMRGRGKGRKLEVIPLDNPKRVPARCTVGCRRYAPPSALDPATVPPYTPAEIRGREMESFGAWLSSTPFDDFPPEELAAADLPSAIESGGEGEYVVVAVVGEVSIRQTKAGTDYAWVSLRGVDGSVDAVCWQETYRRHEPHLTPGRLVVAVLRKDGWGAKLADLAVV